MTDGQPGKLIGKSSISDAKGLVVLLSARADAAALGAGPSQWAKLQARMSLFNVGRFVSMAAGLLIFAFLAERHAATSGAAFTIISAFVAILGLPLLWSGVIQGAKMRLFGAAEFFCGLSYIPMGTMGGAKYRERTYYMLGLIYSGVGRFAEAKKCLRRHDYAHDVFSVDTSSDWSDRKRLPELLARMGEGEEALRLAEQNIALTKHQIKDMPCVQLYELLQCDLVAAATAAGLCSRQEERTRYLDEAIHLEQSSKNMQIIGRYASGMRHYDSGRYHEAIASLLSVNSAIKEAWLNDNNHGKLNANGVAINSNQELWWLTQTLLGKCYLRIGKVEKLPEILLDLQTANRAEPPGSETCVDDALLRIDYLASLGKLDEALKVNADLIKLLASSDCPSDVFLARAAAKYAELAGRNGLDEADALKIGADRLSAHKSHALADTHAMSTTYIAEAPQAIPPRLPNLAETRHIANRAVFLFIAVACYAIYMAATPHATAAVAAWAVLTLLCGSLMFVDVKKHVLNRRNKFYAMRAIERHLKQEGPEAPLNIILQPKVGKLTVLALRNCTMSGGGDGFAERTIELAVNDNLLYVCSAYTAAKMSKVGGRAYMQQDTVVAVEVLGRVLTPVKQEKKG